MADATTLTTAFASPERSSAEELKREHEHIASQELLVKAIDAIPEVIAILNDHRQVLFYNSALADQTAGDRTAFLGSRPGEILGCVHAHENPAGCGTSESCYTCAAVRAVLSALNGTPASHEAQITVSAGENRQALDFRVSATPIEIGDRRYFIVHLVDISGEVRRRVLEHTFFHDIINTASNVRYLAEMLRDDNDPETHQKVMEFLDLVSERLIDEISSHRQLLQAERGELVTDIQYADTMKLMQELHDRFDPHSQRTGIDVVIGPAAESHLFATDTVLLGRVLSNLVKNAMEASESGERVTLSCRSRDDRIEFSVHNRAPMPREVRLQVFNRSFSTKGRDRGIGTYSVRLLTEQYLGGDVSFTTDDREGTTFTISLPRSPA